MVRNLPKFKLFKFYETSPDGRGDVSPDSCKERKRMEMLRNDYSPLRTSAGALVLKEETPLLFFIRLL